MKNVCVEKNKSFGLAIVKSVLTGVVVALALILLFAFLIKVFGLQSTTIKPINQIIKIVSIFIGVLVGYSRCSKNKLIFGLLVGLLFCIIAFLVFSALSGTFELNKTIVNDLLFNAIAGIISAVVVSLIKK